MKADQIPELVRVDTIRLSESVLLQDLRATKAYQDFLVKNGFQEQVFLELETDDHYVFYSIQLKKSGDSGISYSLVVYNLEDVALFSKKDLKDGAVYVAVRAFPTLRLLGELEFDINSPKFGTRTEAAVPSCREKTSTFSECMECALSTLFDFKDDWLTAAACSLNPHLCIAAAVIHCVRV